MDREARVAAGGWLVLATLVSMAWGGAAARPDGVLQAAPAAFALGIILATVLVLVRCVGVQSARFGWGLALVPLLLLTAPGIPGVEALSGPPLLTFALAGTVGAISLARTRPPRGLLVAMLLLVYGTVSFRAQERVGPEGDEPHYLMVTQSLIQDHDLDLRQDFAQKRYEAFHPEPLEPHFRVRGRHGEIYSIHAVGLSLLLLPAYLVGGYPAASFFMALVAVLLVAEVRRLVAAWSGDPGVAEGIAWLIGLSPPVMHYAGLLFTEIPAALGVAYALRGARETERGPLATAAWSVPLALLPWLNVRYALFPVLVFTYYLSGRPRPRTALTAFAPLAVSALAIVTYHSILYGFFDPRRVYGRHPEFSLGTLSSGLPGLFLDQEFGLLAYAPMFALALPGLVRVGRRSLRDGLLLFALLLAVAGTAGSWDMWRGGFNPPARFLVPLVSVLALGLAAELRKGLGAAAALLIGWSLWTGIAGGWRPELVHRDRDGTAPFFRAESGAEEWSRLLPGYVLGEPDRRPLALTWGLALAAASLPWPAPRLTGVRFLCSSLGFVVAAGAASLESARRSEGRDAVRVVGRPALAVPGWALEEDSAGVWSPADLGWGPAFEASRFPAGAPLGNRLMLPPGHYKVEVELDPALPPGVEPQLVVVGEGRHGPTLPRTGQFALGNGSLSAAFEVSGYDRAVSLRMLGGGPLIIRRLVLRAQPSGP